MAVSPKKEFGLDNPFPYLDNIQTPAVARHRRGGLLYRASVLARGVGYYARGWMSFLGILLPKTLEELPDLTGKSYCLNFLYPSREVSSSSIAIG